MTTHGRRAEATIGHLDDRTSAAPGRRPEPGFAAWGKRITLDNLTLSRKEGFQAAAQAPRREQPDLLTVAALAGLGRDARREYELQRSIWHANLPANERLFDLAEALEAPITDLLVGASPAPAGKGRAKRSRH